MIPNITMYPPIDRRSFDGQIKGPIELLSYKLGASEQALSLLISILAGYPLAIFYRMFIYNLHFHFMHHLYFAITGLLLIMGNYGTDVYHSIIAIIFTYIIINELYSHPNVMVVVNLIFHMTYLLMAYYLTESEKYDIIWTMPHCVLVLRLIGLGFNVADGLKKPSELSKDQAETAIPTKPSILELTAFAYFPAACLVGPQFPFNRYMSHVRKEYFMFLGCWRAAGTRLLLGIIYLAIRQFGSSVLPDDFLLTEQYAAYPLWQQWLLLAIWGKLALYKYVSCWLLGEGAATLFGISYVQTNEDGSEDWSALSNIKLSMFERATKLGHYVLSFNVNTNHWVAENVYKRLKFLNNRTISYASALLFLALWHGFHSGYYMSFFMEYLTITFEKQIGNMHDGIANGRCGFIIKSLPIRMCILALRLVYTLVGMGWCLVPFVYLSYDKWWKVYGVLNYAGFVMLAPWFVAYFLFKIVKRQFKTRTE